MKFNEFSKLVNFELFYSGFLVGSKVHSLEIFKKKINDGFYISLACSKRRDTVVGITLYLNKNNCVDSYLLFEKFFNPDFSFFSQDEIFNISLVERSAPIYRDIRSDLHVNNIEGVQQKDVQEWLNDAIDRLCEQAVNYHNIISLNHLDSLTYYNFNRIFLIRAMLENDLSEDFIQKLLSINSKYTIVKDVGKLIEDVYAFKRQNT